MKNTLFLSALILLFSACKKDVTQPVIDYKKPISADITDTVSLNIDGINYTYNQENKFASGNREANKKLDSVDKNRVPHFSNDPDSLLFSKEVSLSGKKGAITFSFFRKFAKKDLIFNNGMLGLGILSPKDNNQLYALGDYNFPVDYNGRNAHNGVAIEVINDKFLTSYDQTFAGYPTNINNNAQDNAWFKIISFKKAVTGGYLIEANFTLTLFDANEIHHTAQNGYLKIHVE